MQRGDETVYAVAVAAPAEESDLRSLSPEVLSERLAGGRRLHYHAAVGGHEPRDDAWSWILVACVACLLGEILVLKAFRT